MPDIEPRYLKAWVAFDLPLRLRMRGESMRSSFPPGTTIVVHRVPPDHVALGDAIVYNDADTVVCHRVVRSRGTHGAGRAFFAAGEVAAAHGTWVAEGDVIGKVVAVEADGRARPIDTRSRRLCGFAAAARAVLCALVLKVLSRAKRPRRREHATALRGL